MSELVCSKATSPADCRTSAGAAATPIEAIFDSVTDALLSIGADGIVRNCNRICTRYFGMSRESLIGSRLDALLPALHGRSLDVVLAPFMADLDDTLVEICNGEVIARRASGEEFCAEINASRVSSEATDAAFVISLHDVTRRKVAETRIFEEKERAQVTLQSIGDGVITTDAEGHIDYLNPVAEHLTGWDTRSVRGKSISNVMRFISERERLAIENPLGRCLDEGRVINLADDALLLDRNGEEVPVQSSAAPIRDRIGNLIGAVMVLHDVSRETRLFRQLSYQAAHDATTGLINRGEFENQLVAALRRIRDDRDVVHAVLYIDLDQFKVVNDTFGHSAGDELLRRITKVIQSNVRSSDIVARLGGNEFGILLEACDQARAMEVAEALRLAVEQFRFSWQDAHASVRCSIGVVMMTHENASATAVMSHADVACYSAKDMGRNRVRLYQDSDASTRHEEMKWVARITRAIEDDRLELYYQPIVGVGAASSESEGRARDHYELLLRMRDEYGNIVEPGQFIPAAERYNMMSMLDRWVVRTALADLADRTDDGEPARYTLAINLSGTSLSEDRFLDFVRDELKRHRLPVGAICFEITETAAISNLSRVIHFMQALKRLGCLFSLDDFGSGLSSFTYLKNLPVDYLKIDGQFVSNIVDDQVDESMVSAIARVGEAMGIETIAERVETQAVLDRLGELGVAYAQGFYIARPESVKSFSPWCGQRQELGRRA